ncbi:hypothetical protein I588_00118 [Enterococcus pallens ATCC BAA-351]|uniref:Uncharacterized protein n=2 Tax=Enterococcus pallens TaxID=160454 RepID=R2QCU7_9ENTE|nr:hypothetical protein UAU_01987 [Enterococcus pallens ATCC BAA-351]EOU24131.1 hypothetical protein I588_00118 [Enterococcus pallens ATCC BAA-351]OJG82096.1 hypothetical protein RV10_GL001960 [Enterococcus pallens]
MTILFSGHISLGTYLKNSGAGFVVTHILSVSESDHEEYDYEIRAIVQHIGTKSEYDEYEEVFTFDDTIENCDEEKDYELEKIGYVTDLDGVCLLTNDILSVVYHEGDLIGNYEGTLFVPWSEDELKSAKKEYLAQRLNVVKG